MKETIETRIKAKKQELKNQQEYFKIDLQHIEQLNYEDNAINALLNMKKLKTEITELELILQLVMIHEKQRKNMNRECTILSKEEMKNHQLNLGRISDNLKTINENIR